MERILDLDFALRQALADEDGESARTLATRQSAVIREVVSAEGGMREDLAREIRDLLIRNIELARSVQEDVRIKLSSVARQRTWLGRSATRRKGLSFSA